MHCGNPYMCMQQIFLVTKAIFFDCAIHIHSDRYENLTTSEKEALIFHPPPPPLRGAALPQTSTFSIQNITFMRLLIYVLGDANAVTEQNAELICF